MTTMDLKLAAYTVYENEGNSTAWVHFTCMYSPMTASQKHYASLCLSLNYCTNTPLSCISGVCNRHTIQTFVPERVNTYNTSKQQSKFWSYKQTNYSLCIIASPRTAHKWDIQKRGSQYEIQTLCKWQYQSSYVQQEPLATWKSSKTTNIMNLMFCWPCIIVYQYNETNVMHFLLNLLRIKGLYMFQALLAHPQESLHKRHSDTSSIPILVQPTDITRTQYNKCRLFRACWGWASNARNV
jgi:hypothetical protein